MKILKIKNVINIVLSDGSVLTDTNCTDDIYNQILANQDNEDFVVNLLVPKKAAQIAEVKQKIELLKSFEESKIITVFGNSVYIKSISELTVPEDLATSILEAELNNDQEALESYLNFWTLSSFCPDSRARTNLFWFLKKYGMTISKSGLFVAYRNVELKSKGSGIDEKFAKFISQEFTRVRTVLKKSPKNYYVGMSKKDELIATSNLAMLEENKGNLYDLYQSLSDENISPVYTDSYSKSFTIKIGNLVTIDRDSCDSNQDNTCSNGLHVAGREWLAKGYFGKQSIMVLVNPADVVAVPPSDNYGKMRVCAYYPIALLDRDSNGDLIDTPVSSGFEDDFISKIAYDGVLNNEDDGNYSVVIPDIPEINKDILMRRLDEISASLKKYVD